jgi:MFS family permease
VIGDLTDRYLRRTVLPESVAKREIILPSLAKHRCWRSIPYACFFFAGVIVARFQYEIYQHRNIKADLFVYEHVGEVINSVVMASVIGILFSLKYLFTDRFLPLVIGMTVLLGVLQVFSWLYIISSTLLNVYAVAYAVSMMSLPFISLIWNRYPQYIKNYYEVGMLAVLFVMGSPAVGFLMATRYGKWIGCFSFVLAILAGVLLLIFRRKKIRRIEST